MPKKKTYKEYIIKAKDIHNNFYIYPKNQEIENNNTKIKIICPKHGEFEQTLRNHLSGQGCPKCGNKKRKVKKYEDYLIKFKDVYGNKYIYPKNQEIKNHNSIISVICPKHGKFKVKVRLHASGNSGCKDCFKENLINTHKKTYYDYIERFKEIHNNFYIYPKNQEIDNCSDYIVIKCPIHGNFRQNIQNHLSGQGCPKCAYDKRTKNSLLSYSDNIEVCKKAHENFYHYPKYQELDDGVFTKIMIKCPNHGWFKQSLDNHKHGHGCSKCNKYGKSKAEKEIGVFIQSYGIKVIYNKRFSFNSKSLEIDVYLPDYKLGIEYDGIYWHNDQLKSKNYHKDKSEFFKKNFNIDIIHIFQNEWILKNNIVKSILFNRLNLNKIKIYARKCEVKIINNDLYKKLVKENHLQGYIRSDKIYALYYENKPVYIMSMGKSRYNKNYDYEILRSFTIKQFSVIGGFSKLIKFIVNDLKSTSIISYVDLRYFTGESYLKSNFKLLKISQPNYFYFKKNTLILHSRLKFQKHKQEKILDNFNPNLSGYQNMLNNDYLRIFDCGNAVYIY
jgi:hypothetical protein